MIVLFTDFGTGSPYVGQLQAVLAQQAPGVAVIELFNDAPAFDPQASAYLLAAYINEFPPDTVFLCVVDPGVGNASRRPVMVQLDGRWLVGPDNGLFDVVIHRGGEVKAWEISWRPPQLSASFHGRDLFAPVAAQLASGKLPPARELTWPAFTASEELAKIIYIDAFGNAISGLRAAQIPSQACLGIGAHVLSRARTFSDVPLGQAFWYENANGLAEIAINQGHAAQGLQIKPADEVRIISRC